MTVNDSTGSGFQEVHHWLSDSDTPDLTARITSLNDTIAPARALLLSQDCSIVNLRASYPRPGAVASQPKRVFFQGNLAQRGGAQEESLAVLWNDTTHTKTKTTHMRGIWDIISFNGEYHPDGDIGADWSAKLDNLKTLLVAGNYGWPSKDPLLSASGSVTNYVIGVDGLVTFTVSGPNNARMVVDSIIEVNFSKINKSTSPLRGAILVQVVNATTLKTVYQIAAGPFVSQGRFSYRGVSFKKYSEMLSKSIGRRAQGRPFGQLPGRARARPRY